MQAAIVDNARAALRDFDRNLPLVRAQPFRMFADLGLLPQRIAASVASLLGGIALLLAAIGIYGIVAHLVASRTREIGVRVALGADAASIRRLVLGQGIRLTLIGSAIGLILAIGIARLVGSLLFGVSPVDPLALGVTAVALAAVALAASLVPARRAARLNPIVALRAE
jgi:ABC-type antimicrobial peptide transport system permease subunit